MFRPLFPFTKEVLDATVKRGGLWFVRNAFEQASEPTGEKMNNTYLITHYNDAAKAETHFNIIGHDPQRFLYRWEDAAHRQRLEAAATRPEGYSIYSAYFYPDYKKRISARHKEKINTYIYRHTTWKPRGGEAIHVDLYLQFGILYLHLKYEGEELKIKFADIESLT